MINHPAASSTNFGAAKLGYLKAQMVNADKKQSTDYTNYTDGDFQICGIGEICGFYLGLMERQRPPNA
jgi:hypothetical protein